MKKTLVISILSFAIVFSVFAVNKGNNSDIISNNIHNKNTIVIDAGHGGVDVGAIGVNSIEEKGINLSIALSLYDFLMISGYDADLIRKGDYEIYPNGIDRSKSDLYNRLDYINSKNMPILISIHQNQFSDEKEWGTQIWYSDNTILSKTIADSILSNIKFYLQPDNKRVNKSSGDNYYLLSKATAPSVMIECGFISNKTESKNLQNKEYQNDLAYTILLGLNGVIYNG